jgi:hypothetical protein
MTEDEQFNLIELRQRKAKEQATNTENTLNDYINKLEAYNLTQNEAEQERRMSIEHEVKAANAKLTARDKQVAGTHYKEMGVQPWDVVDTWPLQQRIGFYRGGALKYIMRMGAKDESIAETGKGIHYLEKLLEVLKEAAR